MSKEFREPENVEVNCLLTDGGLGDHVASLVAINYIVKNYKHVNLKIWVPDYFLPFAQAALPGASIKNFSMAKRGDYDTSKPFITTRWDGRTSGMKQHLLDYAFHTLCDRHVENEEKNYIKVDLSKVKLKENLPDKFVTVTTGFTAPNREFLPQYINDVVKYIKLKGYDVVFLGKRDSRTGTEHTIKGNFKEEINFSEGLNLIDKTSLLETAKVISLSKCIVGLDNGLLHVAGCTDVPIVGGFTNVDPKARMPIRNNVLGWNYYPVVPPEDLGCRFCQSRLHFVYNHDFKNCFYDNLNCLSLLKPELYIQQLEKIL